jgi:hypothetical protein
MSESMVFSSQIPTADHWNRLTVAFEDSFSIDELSDLVRTSFDNVRLDIFARTDTVANAVRDLFEWASRKGHWIKLLGAARQGRPDKPVFVTVCDEVLAYLLRAATPPEQGDPYQSVLLARQLPFVDRKEVRDALAYMADPQGWCGLVLVGPRKVGKTYCHQFLTYLRSVAWGSDRIAQVNLEREKDYRLAPVELARRLVLAVRQMDVQVPGQVPGQRNDRWASDLAVWLANQADQAGTRVWVVLDGFDHPDVPEETHNFIATLAAEAVTRTELRLVLLGYSPRLGDDIESNLWRKPLNYLTADDLQEFFDDLERRRPYRGKPIYQRAAQAADTLVQVYRTLRGGSEEQLQAIDQVFRGIVRDLLRPAPANSQLVASPGGSP